MSACVSDDHDEDDTNNRGGNEGTYTVHIQVYKICTFSHVHFIGKTTATTIVSSKCSYNIHIINNRETVLKTQYY